MRIIRAINRALFIFGLATVLGAILVTFAAGTSATVTWQSPDAYEDGSPLGATDIDHYTLMWSSANGPSGSMRVDGKLLSQIVPIACGSTNFSLSVTTTATARYPNATSSNAGPVPFASGIACAPNPPRALAVQ